MQIEKALAKRGLHLAEKESGKLLRGLTDPGVRGVKAFSPFLHLMVIRDTYYYYDLTYTVDNNHTLDLPKTGADGRSYVWITFAIAAIISVEYYLATRKRKRKAKHD